MISSFFLLAIDVVHEMPLESRIYPCLCCSACDAGAAAAGSCFCFFSLISIQFCFFLLLIVRVLFPPLHTEHYIDYNRVAAA